MKYQTKLIVIISFIFLIIAVLSFAGGYVVSYRQAYNHYSEEIQDVRTKMSETCGGQAYGKVSDFNFTFDEEETLS